MRRGTLVVLEPGGLAASPAEGRVLWFGRNRSAVHICVGSHDAGVSRRHGTLEYSSGCWWVRAQGGRPVRVGRTHVLRYGDEPVPLADGRTSLLVEGSDPNDLHLVRVEVVGADAPPRRDTCSGTAPVRGYRLDAAERLVMTVLAQRVLQRQSGATLLTSREAAAYLAGIQPGVWTFRMIEHLVRRMRERLAAQGVDGLVPEPGCTGYDSAYRRNLVEELIDSGTLGTPDLRLLGTEE
ncbi:MAG: FHA domain-containing protein [Pseudonocardia sp.]|nr:FHA domain-containing protein [Pseudonocardia sp.]